MAALHGALLEHRAGPHRENGVNGLVHVFACITDIHAVSGGTVVHALARETVVQCSCCYWWN